MNIQIEKGIPVPPKSRALIYPMADLEIGDSFAIPEGRFTYPRSIYPSMKKAADRQGIKIVTRKQPDGTFRVWRIA